MKTRILSLCLALVLCAAALTGCGSYNYNLDEYVTVGQYEGVEVSADTIETQLQSTVDSFLASLTTTAEVDRAAKDGDIVNIDYAGTLNGVAFEGGTAEGQNLTLGAGQFVDGFEEGLIGAKKGDNVTLDITFPDDYSNDELKGKDVEFAVTVNSVSEATVPELTDALVAENTTYATVDEYKSAKREIIKQNLAWEAVLANCTVKQYPEKEVKRYYDNVINTYTQYANMYGTTLEGYVTSMMGTADMDTFTASLIANCKSYARNDMIARVICEAQGIEVTGAEYDRIAQMFAEENGFETVKELEAASDKSDIENNVLLQLAIEFVGSKAVEKTAE